MTPDLNKDLSEFVELLVAHKVEFVVVGGFALAFHGHPRYTQDIDFFVRPSVENAEKLERTVKEFGFESLGLTSADFCDPNIVIQLGHEPNRVDLITGIDGLSFEEAWVNKVSGKLGGKSVWFISASDFLKNKRASGRAKDIADAEEIEKILEGGK